MIPRNIKILRTAKNQVLVIGQKDDGLGGLDTNTLAVLPARAQLLPSPDGLCVQVRSEGCATFSILVQSVTTLESELDAGINRELTASLTLQQLLDELTANFFFDEPVAGGADWAQIADTITSGESNKVHIGNDTQANATLQISAQGAIPITRILRSERHYVDRTVMVGLSTQAPETLLWEYAMPAEESTVLVTAKVHACDFTGAPTKRFWGATLQMTGNNRDESAPQVVLAEAGNFPGLSPNAHIKINSDAARLMMSAGEKGREVEFIADIEIMIIKGA